MIISIIVFEETEIDFIAHENEISDLINAILKTFEADGEIAHQLQELIKRTGRAGAGAGAGGMDLKIFFNCANFHMFFIIIFSNLF